jgi:signal transduction histidine kinase
VSADKVGGTGLGLAIAEEAARVHGGCLNLEQSIPGMTVFVLQLPNYLLDVQTLAEGQSE